MLVFIHEQQVNLHFSKVTESVCTTDSLSKEVQKKEEQHQSSVSSHVHQFWVRSGFLKM